MNKRSFGLVEMMAERSEEAVLPLMFDLQRIIHEQGYKSWVDPNNKRKIKKIIRKGKTRVERAKRSQEVS